MTVPATPRKAGPYVGTGTVHTYGFDFKTLSVNHIAVVEADPTGVETTLQYGSDYTVLLNEYQDATPGGTITRIVETVPTPLPHNYRLTILSAVPFSQTTDLPPGGAFSAVVVENGLDNLAMQVQQVAEEVERAVRVPPTSFSSGEQFVNGIFDAADLAAESASIAVSAAAVASLTVKSLSALKALTAGTPQTVYMTGRVGAGDGGHGVFQWFAGDQSANVSADPLGGVWVAPNSAPSGVEGAWARQYSGLVNVKWFGAAGDDVVDDTAAIRGALDFVGQLGGGTVYFPTGTYRVHPLDVSAPNQRTADGHALPFAYSNMTLAGDGIGSSIIRCYGPNGGIADTDYALVDYTGDGTSDVWRGNCFILTGGTPSAPQKNVVFRGIEIDGTATYTGNAAFPASPVNGDGWDITHRGISLAPDQYIEDVTIERCAIHNFKGELTYAGGSQIWRFNVYHSTFYDSNGEAWTAQDGEFAFNTVENMHIGVEPIYMSDCLARVHHNTIRNIVSSGVGFRYFKNGTADGRIEVEHNIIDTVNSYGILCGEAENATIRHNTLIDCGTWYGSSGIRVMDNVGNFQPKTIRNCDISDNRILVRLRSAYEGVTVAVGTHGIKDSRIVNNVSVLTEDARLNGFIFALPFTISNVIEPTLQEWGNHGLGTTVANLESMSVFDTLLETTSTSEILVYEQPRRKRMYMVLVTYRVVEAPTDLRIFVSYRDASSGDVEAVDVVPNETVGVGNYVAPPRIIFSDASYSIRIYGVAGTANQVYVSAVLKEVQS